MANKSIAEWKKIMTDKFIANEQVIADYELDVNKTFEEQFSVVSLESIMFYCFAFCAWVLGSLFVDHVAECNDLIANKKPGSLKWYRDKGLAFRYGRALVPDEDYYDLAGIDPESISGELVVKFCVAVEFQGRVYIKVAGGTDANKTPLDSAIETALNEYYKEINFAGVKIGNGIDNEPHVTNLEADHFKASFDIYYNPMILGADGIRISDGVDIVRNTIKNYVQSGIPFNGEYRNSLLVDELQKIEGVVIPELLESATVTHEVYLEDTVNVQWNAISAKCLPKSGYFKVYNDDDLVLVFKPYMVTNE